MGDFPSLFVIAVRRRGQLEWRIGGFKPVLDRAKAEKKMKPYRDMHGGDYEYRVLEYSAMGYCVYCGTCGERLRLIDGVWLDAETSSICQGKKCQHEPWAESKREMNHPPVASWIFVVLGVVALFFSAYFLHDFFDQSHVFYHSAIPWLFAVLMWCIAGICVAKFVWYHGPFGGRE